MKKIKALTILSLFCVQSYVNTSVAAMKNYFWPQDVNSTCAEKATHFTSAVIIPGLYLGAGLASRDVSFRTLFLFAGAAHVLMHNAFISSNLDRREYNFVGMPLWLVAFGMRAIFLR